MANAEDFNGRIVQDDMMKSFHRQFSVTNSICFTIFGNDKFAISRRVNELSLRADETQQILSKLTGVLQRKRRLFVEDSHENVADDKFFVEQTVLERSAVILVAFTLKDNIKTRMNK